MTVKRRTIWLSDEEWEVLGQAAKKNGWNISQEIRNLWQYADDAADGKPITLRQQENLITSVWVDPPVTETIPGKVSSEMPTMTPGGAPRSTTRPFVSFNPVPKGGTPRRKR